MTGYDGSAAVGLEQMRRIAFDLSAVRDRVTAMEQNARGRLLPASIGAAGSVLTSDGTDASWSQEIGGQVTSGFATKTSNQALAVASANAASITITGDNVSPIRLEAGALALGSPSTVGSDMFAEILDNTTVVQQSVLDVQALGSYASFYLTVVVPAFSGSKTFNIAGRTSAGTGVMYGTSASPIYIRATWAPGYLT